MEGGNATGNASLPVPSLQCARFPSLRCAGNGSVIGINFRRRSNLIVRKSKTE
ncbi:MAG: hypothetical protein ABIR03_12370 [Ginsengibacter sp.]